MNSLENNYGGFGSLALNNYDEILYDYGNGSIASSLMGNGLTYGGVGKNDYTDYSSLNLFEIKVAVIVT